MTTTSSNTPIAPTQAQQAQWDAANKFLGKLLVDSTLSQGYLDICQQANGLDNAPELLNNWLTNQGYDTTPELVYAILIVLQNTSLGYWSGIYGQTFFQDSQGNTSAAPVLKIIPDAQGNAIPYINGIALKKYIFKSVVTNNIPNPTLTWDLDSNSTAGHIIFYYTSPITPESSPPPTGYTGNWFQGTLQTSATTSPKTYYAGLSQPTTPEATPAQTQENFSSDPTNTSFWLKFAIVFGSGLAALVGLGTLIYYLFRVPVAQIAGLQIEENARLEVLENQQNQQGEVNNPEPEIVNPEPEIVNPENPDFVTPTILGTDPEPEIVNPEGEGLLRKDVLDQSLIESITLTSEENILNKGQNFGNVIDQPVPPPNLESIFVESEIYNPEPLNDSQPSSTDSKKEQEPEQSQKVEKKKSAPEESPLIRQEVQGKPVTINPNVPSTPNSGLTPSVQSRVADAPKPSNNEPLSSNQPDQSNKPQENPEDTKSKDERRILEGEGE